MDQIQRYGSYIVGFLGALGALIVALFMPQNQTALISAAGSIALGTFFFSREYKRFGKRLLGMLVAAAVTAFAFFMPAHSDQLLEAAGTVVLFSIVWF